MQETRVWSLAWEDPLEEEMATLSSFLAREIPWTEDPRGLQSMGSQKSQTWFSDQTTMHIIAHNETESIGYQGQIIKVWLLRLNMYLKF